MVDVIPRVHSELRGKQKADVQTRALSAFPELLTGLVTQAIVRQNKGHIFNRC